MPISEVLNIDCMEYMKSLPDNFADLAICDPPYGIKMDEDLSKKLKKHGFKEHNKGKTNFFDGSAPAAEYFIELFRVSKNQIIWGGNYFTQHLPSSMGWLFWDKGQYNFSFSDGELAFTSFNSKLKKVNYPRGKDEGGENGLTNQSAIHPTQKPIVLYKGLLNTYGGGG